MQSLVNGVPKSEVSVMNRGLLYGDGAFETLLVIEGQITLFDQHLSRLQVACKLLNIPVDIKQIKTELTELCRDTKGKAVAKIIITRGEGGRGYQPDLTADSVRILQLFTPQIASQPNFEDGIAITVCRHRLSLSHSLAGIKHLNRIDQVLASSELTADYLEGLCLDSQGFVIEGTKSNLLIVSGGQIHTPDLSQSGVRGIMLTELISRLQAQGIEVEEKKLTLDDVIAADEVMLCNSVMGVSPVIKMNGNGSVKHWLIGDFCRLAIQLQDDAFATF